MRILSALLSTVGLRFIVKKLPAAVAATDDADDSTYSVVDPNDWLHQCAQTFTDHCCLNITAPPDYIKRSNFYLIEEPSGVCADFLFCAFEECATTEAFDDLFLAIESPTEAFEHLVSESIGVQPANNLANMTYDKIKDKLPPLELPERITFPRTALDVVKAVEYAKANDLKISVKSSGHSYTGASTRRGSLMLNMREFAKYSTGNLSVVECAEVLGNNTSNSNQAGQDFIAACALAEARDKKAFIRVGGGQLWSDVYLAVTGYNAAMVANSTNTSKPYGIVGGGAGSVSAAGGWLQGGGLSFGPERMHGLGVDQILDIEMVLPDGRHVRFGPSDWEPAEQGRIYPKTTKVDGVCNKNVVQDESEWDWQVCDDPVPEFADLWFAVRGGGGGTFGVVTSVKYMLFDQMPINTGVHSPESLPDLGALYEANETLFDEVSRLYTMFLVDFLYAPSKLGIDESMSNMCGSPALDFRLWGYAEINCYNDVWSAVAMPAWREAVETSGIANVDQNLAESLKSSTFRVEGPYDNQVQRMMGNPLREFAPEGKVPDSPMPQWSAGKGYNSLCSMNIPLKLLQSNDPEERDAVFRMLAGPQAGQHVTGGLVASTSDGMSAVPRSERLSGLSSFGMQYGMSNGTIVSIASLPDDLIDSLMSMIIKYTTDEGGNFPGYSEYNHLCPGSTTTMKSNWSERCPTSYTDDQKQEECFSIQQSVWGVDLYSKLQDIKTAVDPDHLFDCYPCVKPKVEDISLEPKRADVTSGAYSTSILMGLVLVGLSFLMNAVHSLL